MGNPQARRFLGVAFICCVLLLAGVAAFNWHTNPGGLFQQGDSRPEQVLGGLLASGWNIATDSSFDERALRESQILNSGPNRGTLVFGSSRVMEIRAELIGERGDFLSNWVGSANLEDDFGLMALHLERGASPRRVIIGIDPWIFNGQGAVDPRSGTLEGPMNRLAVKLKVPPGWARVSHSAEAATDSAANAPLAIQLRRYAQLISWGYLSQSLQTYFQRGSSAEKTAGWVHYQLNHQDWNETRTYRKDGSLGYDRKYRERLAAEIEADALQYATPPVFKLDGFTRVDPSRAEALDAFLGFLQASGIEVELYLPPYHPITYTALMKSPLGPLLHEVEETARKMASRHGIRIFGSYDPVIAGCQAADFYDAMHVKGASVAKILAAPAR